jgi:hypothetical protein
MALKGNLAVFTTTQLLNLINLSKRTGILSIYQGERTGRKLTLGDGETQIDELAPGRELANLVFAGGMLVYAEMAGKDDHLTGILQRAGKLNEEQARAIRDKAAGINDKGLALRLINANYVTKNDIVRSIQKHTVSIVFDLMTWKTEPFEFKEGAAAPDSRILVPIDLKNVIIEGIKIHKKQLELERELPNLDLALRFPDDPGEKFKDVKLDTNAWRVVGFINPRNSIRQIAKSCNMTDTEIREIVYSLMQAGLVQVVKPVTEQKRMTTTTDVLRPRPPVANTPSRAVVNRLIAKIKEI